MRELCCGGAQLCLPQSQHLIGTHIATPVQVECVVHLSQGFLPSGTLLAGRLRVKVRVRVRVRLDRVFEKRVLGLGSLLVHCNLHMMRLLGCHERRARQEAARLPGEEGETRSERAREKLSLRGGATGQDCIGYWTELWGRFL